MPAPQRVPPGSGWLSRPLYPLLPRARSLHPAPLVSLPSLPYILSRCSYPAFGSGVPALVPLCASYGLYLCLWAASSTFGVGLAGPGVFGAPGRVTFRLKLICFGRSRVWQTSYGALGWECQGHTCSAEPPQRALWLRRHSPSGLLPQQPDPEWVTAWWTSDPGVSSSGSRFPGSEAQDPGEGSTEVPGGRSSGVVDKYLWWRPGCCCLTALTPHAHSANWECHDYFEILYIKTFNWLRNPSILAQDI